MANVPDNSVLRRVVDIMQGNGELNNAEAGTKVTACLTRAPEHKLA